MSAEIQELRHRINALDRKRKALRAEAMVLGLRGKKKLAEAKRLNARKIDSEILTYKRRIDKLRSQKKPLIKLPKIKLPPKKAKPAGKPGPGPLARAKARAAAQAAQAQQSSAAVFQPSEASSGGGGGGGGGMPGFPPASMPTGPEFQPSSASFTPEGGMAPTAAAAGAEAASSEGGGPPVLLLLLGAAAVVGGGYYLYRRTKAGSKGAPALLGAATKPAGSPAARPALTTARSVAAGGNRTAKLPPFRRTFRVGGK